MMLRRVAQLGSQRRLIHALSAAAAAADPSSTSVGRLIAGAITPAAVAHLRSFGFVVVDDALGPPAAAASNAADSALPFAHDRSPAFGSPLADELRAQILALH